MTSIISYFIEVSTVQIILYGFYYFFMKNGTHFNLNRIYLISSLIFSFIFSFIKPNFTVIENSKRYSEILQLINISDISNNNISLNSYLIYEFIKYFYYLGLVLFTISFIKKLLVIIKIYKFSLKEKKNGYTIAYTKTHIQPFSFFNTIYIYNNQFIDKHIMLHELAHIKQKHSYDVIIAELSCIISWFNPITWLIKSRIKETHEYLADLDVTKQIDEKTKYFQLLITTILGISVNLSNSFNKSLTLKRITMMTKRKSDHLSRVKVLLVLPVLMFLFAAFSAENISFKSGQLLNNENEITEVSKGKVEEMPTFPGGEAALINYLVAHINYPEEAKKQNIQGVVYVDFLVTKEGKIGETKVIKGVNKLLDNEALRVISGMPLWNPGKVKGEPVDVKMVLPISFKLSNDKSK